MSTAPTAAATSATTSATAASTAATTSAATTTALAASGGQLLLKITQQPQNSLAYTNHVFVHPAMTQAYPKGADAMNYLSIGGHVFIVKPHAAVAIGAIGLNKLQRDSCGLGEHDSVMATVFIPPANDVTFNLASLRIEFETYGTGIKKIMFKEEEMLDVVKGVFVGQVLTKSQQFWGTFGGYTLMYQIKSLEAPIKEEKNQSRTYPTTTTSTSFSVSSLSFLLHATYCCCC
jgi:hypothetical protein